MELTCLVCFQDSGTWEGGRGVTLSLSYNCHMGCHPEIFYQLHAHLRTQNLFSAIKIHWMKKLRTYESKREMFRIIGNSLLGLL